jgi:hypothetical protein
MKQFDYFIKNFHYFYNIEGITIEYGVQNGAKISIVKNADNSFWNGKEDIIFDQIIWKEWKGRKIPFLFDKSDENEIITNVNGKVVIKYDIVASSFYFLSGWNEYVSKEKDEFGRIKYDNSIIKKLNIIETPVVNYYFDILNEAICQYTGCVKKTLWGNYDFGVALTHDIDTCNSAWLEGSFSELKKRHFLTIPKLIVKRFFDKDDWFNFDKITQIEMQYKATSSFYFLPQKGKTENWKNADYNIKSKSIQKAISFLKSGGNEIGVHGSFGTHANAKKLIKDIERVNSNPIFGNRFHFLMFNPEKTVSVLEECGVKYDTSLSFAEQIGFRRGTCFPFHLYNFEKNELSSIIEIPLIVMDATLQNKRYMGLSQEKSLNYVFELIKEVMKFQGVFTILWHNTLFSDYKYTGWKDVYIKILEFCKANNGFLTSGMEIYSKTIK